MVAVYVDDRSANAAVFYMVGDVAKDSGKLCTCALVEGSVLGVDVEGEILCVFDGLHDVCISS